jgi:hypothetical protein
MFPLDHPAKRNKDKAYSGDDYEQLKLAAKRRGFYGIKN